MESFCPRATDLGFKSTRAILKSDFVPPVLCRRTWEQDLVIAIVNTPAQIRTRSGRRPRGRIGRCSRSRSIYRRSKSLRDTTASIKFPRALRCGISYNCLCQVHHQRGLRFVVRPLDVVDSVPMPMDRLASPGSLGPDVVG